MATTTTTAAPLQATPQASTGPILQSLPTDPTAQWSQSQNMPVGSVSKQSFYVTREYDGTIGSVVSLQTMSSWPSISSLFWNVQVNLKTNPLTANPNLVSQVWFSANFLADATQQANFMCTATYASSVPTLKYDLTTGTKDYNLAGATTPAGTYQSQTPIDSSDASKAGVMSNVSTWNLAIPFTSTATAEGLFATNCIGARGNFFPSGALSQFKVGDQIKFRTGYKLWTTSTGTILFQSAPTQYPSYYTLLNSAVALTMSAAVSAVLALTF